MKNATILERQKKLNFQLSELFSKNGIKNFCLTSVGNSIASGYSMVRITKPLLLRNDSLQAIFNSKGINTEIHHFARGQNNNDEHIFEWLTTNIKETQMHELNRIDFGGDKHSMYTEPLTKYDMDKYYPLVMEKDRGFQDIVFEKSLDLANIIVYNGATGSFLDNVTRNGKISQKITYGVKRDLVGLESTLKYIQNNNRKNNTNTQVYLCGAPDFMGLHIVEIINKRLKKLAKQYANVTYVEPVKSKFLYQQYGSKPKNSFEKLLNLRPDIHYDETEYQELNNHIIESIYNNYFIKQCLINLDRAYYLYNSQIESNKVGYDPKMIENILQSQVNSISDENSKKRFLDVAKSYIIERYPYDFYYLQKNTIQETFKSNQK